MSEIKDSERRHDHHRPVPFTVDQEPQIGHADPHNKEDVAVLTVKEVLDMSGNQPAENFYLVEYKGEHHHDSTKHEDLSQVLIIRPHTRFSAVYKGPTETT